jgi:hypothetical protein
VWDLGLDELQELFLGDLEILGELLWTHEPGHCVLKRVPVSLHELESVAMVLFQGAAPGGFGLLGGLFERLAFEDQGSELDGAVSGGRQAAGEVSPAVVFRLMA